MFFFAIFSLLKANKILNNVKNRMLFSRKSFPHSRERRIKKKNIAFHERLDIFHLLAKIKFFHVLFVIYLQNVTNNLYSNRSDILRVYTWWYAKYIS